MSPSVVQAAEVASSPDQKNGYKTVDQLKEAVKSSNGSTRQPLKLSGVLDQYKSFDVTPVIGKEYPDADLVEWLHAPNSDELIRDLAITSELE